MPDPKPIACTLTAEEMKDRVAAWNKLLTSGLVERERVPGGIRLTAEVGASAALMQLVALERDCCEGIQFDTSNDSVTMTADTAGEEVLATMFNPIEL